MMGDCTKIQDYVARLLEGTQRVAFEKHLKSCPHCQQKLIDTENINKAADRYFALLKPPIVTTENTSGLLNRAERYRALTTAAWIKIAAAAVICGGLFFGIGFYLLQPSSDPKPASQHAQNNSVPKDNFFPTQNVPLSQNNENPITILSNTLGTFEVNEDNNTPLLTVTHGGHIVATAMKARLGLGQNTQLALLNATYQNTRFHLIKGTCAFDVQPRKEGSVFSIIAGNREIIVVGTVFQVTLLPQDTLQVLVAEGEVKVIGPGMVGQKVGPGEVVEIDESTPMFGALSPEQEKELADLLEVPTAKNETDELSTPKRESKQPSNGNRVHTGFDPRQIRKKILQKNFSAAMQLLNARLTTHPSDTEALALKGDCLRKLGRFQDAAQTYVRVSKQAGSRAANRARLSAAVLYQDKLGNAQYAAKYLETYLAQSKSFRPMEAEAMYRLARAYQKIGQTDKATLLLKKVSNEHAGTAAAISARKQLSFQSNN